MSKTMDINELLAKETPALRAKMRERGRELIKAETLRQLRLLSKKKQIDVIGMKQDGVSRLETRGDLLLSSLDAYVRGLGGTLTIIADLPEIGAVDLRLATVQNKVAGATVARKPAAKTRRAG